MVNKPNGYRPRSFKDKSKRSKQLKCECKIPTFTRTVDEDFNCMCGKCGRTL